MFRLITVRAHHNLAAFFAVTPRCSRQPMLIIRAAEESENNNSKSVERALSSLVSPPAADVDSTARRPERNWRNERPAWRRSFYYLFNSDVRDVPMRASTLGGEQDIFARTSLQIHHIPNGIMRAFLQFNNLIMISHKLLLNYINWHNKSNFISAHPPPRQSWASLTASLRETEKS